MKNLNFTMIKEIDEQEEKNANHSSNINFTGFVYNIYFYNFK